MTTEAINKETPPQVEKTSMIHVIDHQWDGGEITSRILCGVPWPEVNSHKDCPGHNEEFHGERFCRHCGRAVCGACLIAGGY